MSDSNPNENAAASAAAPEPTPKPSAAAVSAASQPVVANPNKGKLVVNVAVLISAIALGVSAWQYYETREIWQQNQVLMQEKLAEQAALAKTNRTDVEQALKNARANQAEVALLNARVSEAAGQYDTLNNMYQQLAAKQNDWLVSEVEHILVLANQQLQIAGNIPATISALEMAVARLDNVSRPELSSLKKAIEGDLAKLKALPPIHTTQLAAQIDTLLTQLDHLPLVVDAHRYADPATQTVLPTVTTTSALPWYQALWQQTLSSLSELVKIRRMDKPDALLLSPEQAFFLRENIKLRLLDMRVALLQRDGATYLADNQAAYGYVERYFDRQAPQTQEWLKALQALKSAPIDATLPNLNASFQAVKVAESQQGAQ